MARRVLRTPARSELVGAAARLIADEGAPALTLRRLADEVGTSTMAIYTHFGGMPELRRAVRWDGYAGLAVDLRAVPRTDDPVADLEGLCRAYCAYGVAHAELYRTMFMEQALDEEDADECAGTFDALVEGARRCVDAGAFAPADPLLLATELWAAGHGVVTLQLSGALGADAGAAAVDGCLRHLFAGFAAR